MKAKITQQTLVFGLFVVCCGLSVIAQEIVSTVPLSTRRTRISLDGKWRLKPGKKETGVKGKWFAAGTRFEATTKIPGVWHFGKRPPRTGVWFKKIFQVPAGWKGGRIWLHIGGVKPAADLWMNGTHLGFTVTSRSPLKVDVTEQVRVGQDNTVAVCVTWPKVRLDGVWDYSKSKCDYLYWEGIYRSVFMERTPQLWIDEVHVATQPAKGLAIVNVTLRGNGVGGKASRLACRISSWKAENIAGTASWEVSSSAKEHRVSLRIPVKEARLWSTHEPNLYVAKVALHADGSAEPTDEIQVRFGFRTISTKGNKILLNGTPVFLRGGCDDQSYPRTSCPPNSKEFFLKRLRLAKAYGFNYTKSCIEIFPQEFLEAADEVGYMVCQEMPFGLMGEIRALKVNPPEEFRALYRCEVENMVRADWNHPSVIMYSMTSELPLNKTTFEIFSRELPTLCRRLNPGTLLIDATDGFGVRVETKHGKRMTDVIETRGVMANTKMPHILHEWKWWTSLPNPAVKKKYEGLPHKPNGVNIMEAAAAKSGLTYLLPRMFANSEQLKYALRKKGLEEARIYPVNAGYHHWLIHDFNACPEGVFDEFWEPRPNLSAEEFRTYNDDTVVLLGGRGPVNYQCGVKLTRPLMVSHFGPKPLAKVTLEWALQCDGRPLFQGKRVVQKIDCGTILEVVKPDKKIPQLERARELTLIARLLSSDGKLINRNAWRLWAFPKVHFDLKGKKVRSDVRVILKGCVGAERLTSSTPPKDTVLLITETLSPEKISYLERGGSVLLFSYGALPQSAGTRFRTNPYNKGEGNMGTLIRKHPAMDGFPHGGWCDYQFYSMIRDFPSIDLDRLKPAKINPIVRSFSAYFSMRNWAHMFEAKVGKGRLLATSFNIRGPFGYRRRTLMAEQELDGFRSPETQCLVAGLLSYCLEDRFAPPDFLPPAVLRSLLPKK